MGVHLSDAIHKINDLKVPSGSDRLFDPVEFDPEESETGPRFFHLSQVL
jgi:hypothetical protein